MSLVEEIDSTGNTFEIKCATEKIYNCSNFGIQTNYTIVGKDINIEFEKLLPQKSVKLLQELLHL